MKRDSMLWSLKIELITVSRLICDRSWAGHGQLEHIDPFGRLYYLRSGEGIVRHHGRIFHLRPGYLFAIPAYVASRYLCPRKMDLSYIHYVANIFDGMEPFRFMGWDYVLKVKDVPEMNRLWDELIAGRDRIDDVYELESDGILRRMFAMFAGTSVPDKDLQMQNARRFYPVFSYVENNLNKTIKLSEMAGLVHLQPTYFSNLFTKLMGMTPITYVNRQKIKRSQELLRSREMTLQEIAEAVGFDDVFYFSRVFKKETGMSPSMYRDQEKLEG